jgi:hypothetical protein
MTLRNLTLISKASGLQTGYATLDSIRAVLQSGNFTGLDPDPIITLHGYSGGSISAGWVFALLIFLRPRLIIQGIRTPTRLRT